RLREYRCWRRHRWLEFVLARQAAVRHTGNVLRLLIALTLPLSAQTLVTTWGMSPTQVRSVEKGKAVQTETGLEFGGGDARRVYIFKENKLVRVRFVFSATHGDQNDFIRDFRSTQERLAAQYGKPSDDRAIWTNDSTQQEPKSYLDQDRATAT